MSNEIEVREIELDNIAPSPHNKRNIDPNSDRMQSMIESIRQKGIIQPIVVRAIPKKGRTGGHWQIVAGHRRATAAAFAEQERIPAIIRELDDQGAMEITVIENLEREDLLPLEEAEQIKVLIDNGWDVDDIATHIGRSRQWVHTRARIADLSKKWKDGIAEARKKRAELSKKPDDDQKAGRDLEGITFDLYTIAHLEALAKAPQNIQDKLFDYFSNYWQPPSPRDIRNRVNEYMRNLGEAPFDILDAELVKGRGSCETCIDRAGMQRDLFGLNEDVPVGKDRCLDGLCFENKIVTNAKRVLKIEQDEDASTIGVTPGHFGYYTEKGYTYAPYKSANAFYGKAKEDEEGAIPAVIMGKEGQGEKTHVKLICAINPDTGRPWEKTPTLGSKRNELKETRKRECRSILANWLEAIAADSLTERGWDVWKVLRLAFAWCQRIESPSWSWEFPGKDETLEARLADYAEKSEADLFDQVWTWTCHKLLSETNYKDLKMVAGEFGEFGVSWKDVLKVAREKHPEPEEWKGLPNDAPVPPPPEDEGNLDEPESDDAPINESEDGNGDAEDAQA